MKKIYTLIGALAVTSASFAQQPGLGKINAVPAGNISKPVSSNLQKTAALVAGDTIGWQTTSADILPEFAPTGSLTRYGYTGGGYIFGRNVASLNVCAAGFINLNAATITIDKVIFSAYAKKKMSTGTTSQIKVSMYSMAQNKALNESAPSSTVSALNSNGPNAILSTVAVPFDNIDTTSYPSQMGYHFTTATFSVPVTTSSDFAIAIDARTTAGLLAGDTLGLLADSDDPNNTLDMTFHLAGANWYVTDFAFGDLKTNIAIFPVVGITTAVNEYVNGVKLSALYPNPTKDVATISYSLEKVSNNVSLEVFSATGQKVYDQSFGTQQAGDYKINLDASTFAAGSYFYQLRSNGSLLTKEFIVTK